MRKIKFGRLSVTAGYPTPLHCSMATTMTFAKMRLGVLYPKSEFSYKIHVDHLKLIHLWLLPTPHCIFSMLCICRDISKVLVLIKTSI